MPERDHTGSGKICFVNVFNHKYERNVPKLEKIYQGRFSDIYHIMPFYQGAAPNVIPVYESSYRFEGYLAQSLGRLYDEKYTHYVFSADDLILNRRLTDHNLLEELGLGPDTAYIKMLSVFSQVSFGWPQFGPTVMALSRALRESFVACQEELPSADEALARLEAHGIQIPEVGWQHLKHPTLGYRYNPRDLISGLLFLLRRRRGNRIPYPLLQGYSDFVIVPTGAIKPFCHLCGVFAAMSLFVEVAIPTALALSCRHIVTEAQTPWRGVELWDADRVAAIAESNDFQVARVLDGFNEHQLYLHPIKLSRFKDVTA